MSVLAACAAVAAAALDEGDDGLACTCCLDDAEVCATLRRIGDGQLTLFDDEAFACYVVPNPEPGALSADTLATVLDNRVFVDGDVPVFAVAVRDRVFCYGVGPGARAAALIRDDVLAARGG